MLTAYCQYCDAASCRCTCFGCLTGPALLVDATVTPIVCNVSVNSSSDEESDESDVHVGLRPPSVAGRGAQSAAGGAGAPPGYPLLMRPVTDGVLGAALLPSGTPAAAPSVPVEHDVFASPPQGQVADTCFAGNATSGAPGAVAPFGPTCPEEAAAAADDKFDAEMATDREAAEWMNQSLDCDLRWEGWISDEEILGRISDDERAAPALCAPSWRRYRCGSSCALGVG